MDFSKMSNEELSSAFEKAERAESSAWSAYYDQFAGPAYGDHYVARNAEEQMDAAKAIQAAIQEEMSKRA